MPVIRSGLIPNSEPARECRTFPLTETLNGSSSLNNSTQCEISMQRNFTKLYVSIQ